MEVHCGPVVFTTDLPDNSRCQHWAVVSYLVETLLFQSSVIKWNELGEKCLEEADKLTEQTAMLSVGDKIKCIKRGMQDKNVWTCLK